MVCTQKNDRRSRPKKKSKEGRKEGKSPKERDE